MSNYNCVVTEVVGLFQDTIGKDGWLEAYEQSICLIMDELNILEDDDAKEILDKIIKENRL